jgi:DNA-binding response OmpR family regulator
MTRPWSRTESRHFALDSEDAPRLAILDWMMPGIEGVQICQRLRERKDQPYIYVLLLTARSQKQDLLYCLELGTDDHLTNLSTPRNFERVFVQATGSSSCKTICLPHRRDCISG